MGRRIPRLQLRGNGFAGKLCCFAPTSAGPPPQFEKGKTMGKEKTPKKEVKKPSKKAKEKQAKKDQKK
jgi:hypothetical protein